jgi:hypothetical protein
MIGRHVLIARAKTSVRCFGCAAQQANSRTEMSYDQPYIASQLKLGVHLISVPHGGRQ